MKKIFLALVILFGCWTLAVAQPGFGPLVCIGEQDGDPSVNALCGYGIKFSNGSVTDNGDGTISVVSGTTSPGGSDTEIQFNDGGSFGGDSNFTFDKTADDLRLGGADPTIFFDTTATGDTHFWMGLQDDAGNDDDDYFVIGEGNTAGSQGKLFVGGSTNLLTIGREPQNTSVFEVYRNAPTSNLIIFRVATSDDSSRFSVDEDGDVDFDGELTISRSASILSPTDMTGTSFTVSNSNTGGAIGGDFTGIRTNGSGGGAGDPIHGLRGTATFSAGFGTQALAAGLYGQGSSASGSTLTLAAGVYGSAFTGSGTKTANYGVYSNGILGVVGDIQINGDSARIFGLQRHTTSNTAGNSLTINSGGATSSATDKNGGDLILSSGIATGNGESKIQFITANGNQGAGTTDRSGTVKVQIDEGHIETLNSTPSLSSCGTTPTRVGNDIAGRITIGSGTTTSCTLTFAVPYTNNPACVITGDDAATVYADTASTSTLVITSSADMAADVIKYICIGYE